MKSKVTESKQRFTFLYSLLLKDEIVKIPVSTGDEGEKIYKKMIPAILLEKKVAEIKEKDKTITLLEKKVRKHT